MVYLDNNATTRVDPDVVAAMLPFLTEHFANPSSAHGAGETVAAAIREARRNVRLLIGAERDEEIVFTSGGTEADNTAILSALETQPDRRKIVTSTVEHPAILALCEHLRRTRGVVIERVPVDRSGRLDRAAYRAALGPGTVLVTIMAANNETGTLFPIAELAEEAHAAGALFHTDAVQAVGKTHIDVSAARIDLLSLSGHKLHAPKGIGALYVRKGIRLNPLLLGGKQERGRRAGTENVPAIVALGRAAMLAAERSSADEPRIRALRDQLESGMLRSVPDCAVLGDPTARLANTSCMTFDRAEAEPILMALSKAGIAASSGSACASGSMEPSHVLKAMAVPWTSRHGAVRFSLSRETTQTEIDRVLAVLPGIVAYARSVSSFAAPAFAAE